MLCKQKTVMQQWQEFPTARLYIKAESENKKKKTLKRNRKFRLVTCAKRTARIQLFRSDGRMPACHQKRAP